MTLKQLAKEIYAMPCHLRANRLAEIQPPDIGMVKAYMDQMRKRDQDENRRRNAIKAGFGLPPRKSIRG